MTVKARQYISFHDRTLVKLFFPGDRGGTHIDFLTVQQVDILISELNAAKKAIQKYKNSSKRAVTS